MGRLDGKVAFVTGAGGGIGRASCARLIEEGARVAAADIDPQAAAQAVAGAAGGQALAIGCDVGDPDAMRGAIERTAATFGRLDVLVNIAGGSTPADGSVVDASVEEFWRAIRLDLFGTFLCCKYGIPELVKAGGGSIVNFTSILGLMGLPNRACYSAAKGGVIALTRAMAAQHGAQGIRANAIAPGTTLTPRVLSRSDPSIKAQSDLGRRHVLGLIDPAEVADVVVFLASNDSRKVTGQVIPVDSGVTAT